ncbi:Disintegrin and metalloproteinase domain-containing protein 5 [Fukomys damarensis]|uniref:Disintegrin and metalloproteinase domain-containing protein 5 n=1 Tax=Fukomys damarensis TaxID=885580 RepID=A0A091DWC3_FUKDA|nr:Disintegrin and metalloproteinase domain-containing protein 5 [Fukomys damarensis]
MREKEQGSRVVNTLASLQLQLPPILSLTATFLYRFQRSPLLPDPWTPQDEVWKSDLLLTLGSYSLNAIVKSFLASASVVYSYDKNGAQHSQSLLPRMDCSYSGYVVGFPHSLVALTTCSGLRGVMQFKNISYGIEPLEAMSGFMHMIYEESNNDTHVPLFGENDTYAWLNTAKSKVRSGLHKTEFTKLFPRYIEMYIIVDKNLFVYMGSDVKTVTLKVIRLIGFVNTMLTQLKLTVVISTIELWSNTNKFATTGHPDDVLFRFLQWKHQHADPKPHYISYLLAFEKHPTRIGATFPGYMCGNKYDAGVALYPVGLSLESYAVIIVQLLGLNVGLVYDNTDTCHCLGDICTMTPKAAYSGVLTHFSTCSLDSFKSLASRSGLDCLKNNPHDKPVYKQSSRKRICGNSVREEGEECDCGTKLNCTHTKCCDPTSCRKKGSVVCGSGECCTTDCQLKKANTLCRPSIDKECDFDEFCTGKQGDCVPDTYARDGSHCDAGGAFCFGGICRTFDRQCQSLIGGDSRGAPFACFEEVNSRGDSYGNCGHNFCQLQHVLCGKLVCTWPHKRLVSRENLSVVYTHVRNDICVAGEKTVRKTVRASLSTYLEHTDRDETFVEDGSMCGPDMVTTYFKLLLKIEVIFTLILYQPIYLSQHYYSGKMHVTKIPILTILKCVISSIKDIHNVQLSPSCFLITRLFCFVETGSHDVVETDLKLCSPGWSRTYRDPPASAF